MDDFADVRRRSRRGALVITLLALALPAQAAAQGPLGPLNDLFAIGLGSGQTPNDVPVVRRDDIPQEATPSLPCGPGSKPDPDVQGRMAHPPADGYHCNVTLVAHQGTSGGFKTLRYIDTHGRECAYYDTALLFPINALKLSGDSLGVAVLDMSDPAHPVQTDTLTAPSMLSPHESLALNAKRGLIAAVLGNPAVYPGLVSVYDAHEDCRHPVLQSALPLARLGHESGFSADGRTFFATAVNANSIAAIDMTDPANPHDVWQGNINSHGMSLSEDGTRAYLASTAGNLTILDTSQIQERKPNPQVREISRTTWKNASIPQNAYRFTSHGKPYILEFDEYTQGTTSGGDRDNVGAGRILDISDDRAPHVVSNLRLAVNQHDAHKAAGSDPGAQSPVQGYAAHYCSIPEPVDPTVIACSFIASGLRVFDISDVAHPKEIGYFNAPATPRTEDMFDGSNFAMSQPVVVPARHEVWYTDGTSGFYVLRVADAVWPAAAKPAAPALTCAGTRRFAAHMTLPRGARVAAVTTTLAGRRIATTRRGRTLTTTVDLRRLQRTAVRLVVRVRLRDGRTITYRRTFHPCKRG